MQLTGQKILVTGATGFIGGHLTRRLLAEKRATVRALVRDPARAQDLARQGAEVVRGDLVDVASLERAVQGCSVVIHAAAQVSSVPSRATFEQSNVRGTGNLLRAAAAANVRRFVHLSSIAVFGLASEGEVTDESPRQPCGEPYCDTKVGAEAEVFRVHRERGLPVVVVRPSAVYGPGSTHWSIIPLKRVKKGKMVLFDRGRGMLNYVYIDNLVDAILLVTEDDRALGEAFIVNDGATTWKDFFESYARMAGKHSLPSLPLWAGKVRVRYRNLIAALKRESYRVHPDAVGFLVARAVYRQTRLEQKLGFRSGVSLEEGMRRTEKWFREAGLL